MRKPEYLSPSSLKTWFTDRQQYYRQYLCEVPTTRMPQTQPMSVGSAFDAFCKSFLVEKLIGKDPQFEFQTIFELQVEPHNRDWALEAGRYCFETYKKLGALNDIFTDLQGCVGKPRFEADIKGTVTATIGSVPLRGKPDLFFITNTGVRVVFDWKVNGFCSNASPKQGYIRLRSFGKDNGKTHPECNLYYYDGFKISGKFHLEDLDVDWAAQTAIYAWLLGEDVGSPFVCAIDQLACKRDVFGGNPDIRVAQHRCKISPEFQAKVFQEATKVWKCIQTGHIFDDMSREESDALCQSLDDIAATPPDPLFLEMMGQR